MRALLVIDLQKGIISQRDCGNEINNIRWLIKDFKSKNMPIIFTKHLDESVESPLYKKCEGIEIIDNLDINAKYIVEKSKPDSFCCLFTSIVAADKNFKVYFIEDATGTVCDENTYEMPGLDIQDFIGSILNWSDMVNVLYLDEYKEEFI